jgi:hypothetical protein
VVVVLDEPDSVEEVDEVEPLLSSPRVSTGNLGGPHAASTSDSNATCR